jgi:hypothetical protein
MNKQYKLCVPRGTGGKTLPPIPLAGQIELIARIRIKGESPATAVVHEICDRFGVPRRAANCISGYRIGVERLLTKGDPEVIRLAREWDLPIEEIAEDDDHLADDTEPDDGTAGDHHVTDGDGHSVDDFDRIDDWFDAHADEFIEYYQDGQRIDFDDDITLDGYSPRNHDADRRDDANSQEGEHAGKVDGDGNAKEVTSAT